MFRPTIANLARVRKDLLPKGIPAHDSVSVLKTIEDSGKLRYKLNWDPHAKASTNLLPFMVERGSFGSIPVYNRYEHKGPVVVTVVKNFKGDVVALSKELDTLCQEAAKLRKQIPPRVLYGEGTLKVRGGDYSELIRAWIDRLGF